MPIPRGPARDPDIQDLLAGHVVEGRAGPCFVAERAFALDHVHGGESLSGFLGLADRAIACLGRDPGPSPLALRDVVFLDTETTGLSGGTGTYVFMVGLGFFDGDRFLVRQYFMRHHAEEPAMLAELNALFPRFRAVVSYNGKAFDLPLLETRFRTDRRRSALRAEPHLDLLFAARRVWRDRLPSCSLGTVEQSILGHVRHRDVPSWAIPELYFRYVRGGDARPMVGVFEHNLDDVLSLVALACHLGRLMDDPLKTTSDADDLFAVARLYQDLGFWEDACRCYERALAVARSGVQRARIAGCLAQLCKRSGRAERAVELWRHLVATGDSTGAAYVELAKHYEWGARDYAAAIAVVEQALTLAQPRSLRQRSGSHEWAELEQRLARLLQKQRRARTSPG